MYPVSLGFCQFRRLGASDTKRSPVMFGLLHYITYIINMGVSKNTGTPKWMVKIMENPIKMDDLGVPIFLETAIYACIHHTLPTTKQIQYLKKRTLNAGRLRSFWDGMLGCMYRPHGASALNFDCGTAPATTWHHPPSHQLADLVSSPHRHKPCGPKFLPFREKGVSSLFKIPIFN